MEGKAWRRVWWYSGLVLCLLLATLIVVSSRYSLAWRNDRYKAAVTAGVFWFQWLGIEEHDTAGWRFLIIPIEGGFAGSWSLRWWIDYDGTSAPYLIVPLWIPLAVVAGVAGGGLLCGRLGGRGCRCGYDLTGNVSGRCPECGRPIVRPPAP